MTAKKSATKRPRYVLIIEDNSHHAELITEVLDHHFAPIVIHTVDTIEDGLEFATQTDYDLILTAGVISDTPIAGAIPKINKVSGGTPLVVISGRGDERLAAEIIKKGAAEYLVKSHETLKNLSSLLERHFSSRKRLKQKKDSSAKTGSPSNTSIVQEVDKITRQALSLAGPKRKKHGNSASDIEQLDTLLKQIQHLRDMASKLKQK